MYENINPYELEKKCVLHEVLCIYFLFNEKDEIIYVGQSANVYYRIHCHFQNIIGIKKMAFYPISKDEANNAEAYLIVKYSPKFNKNIPQNDIYISRKSIKKILPILGVKELELHEFIESNGIKEINSYFKKKDLRGFFAFHNLKNLEEMQ